MLVRQLRFKRVKRVNGDKHTMGYSPQSAFQPGVHKNIIAEHYSNNDRRTIYSIE